jgi:hypothetical protein
MQARKSTLRMVAAPKSAADSPPVDPIYAAIEAHQKAHRGHVEAVRIEFAFEESTICERDMDAEQRRTLAGVQKATSAAFDRMEKTSIALVMTKPTTLAGIGAVCRYLKLVLEDGTPGFPLENKFGDVETGMAVFCDTIAAAVEAMA